MIDALWTDIRLSIRGLRRSPGFSLTVIATLALGIAANITILSLLNAIVLRTIPVFEPHRLVAISTTNIETSQPGFIYADTFVAFRAQQRSFAALSMYSGGGFPRVEARGTTSYVGLEGVSSEYLFMAGARPVTGRFFGDTDNHLAAADTPVVVITDRLWQRMFGRDPRAVGDTLKIDGRLVTIIGVTSPGFYGLQTDSGSDLFVPLSAYDAISGGPSRVARARNVIGRLAPGVTIERARAEVLARWPALLSATLPSSLPPAEQSAIRSQRVAVDSVATGFSTLRRLYGTSLLVLIGCSAVLLGIGCVNLTGMMLARGLARHHQFAVRRALGAGRWRLFQQSLLDSLLLASCALFAALPLAWWSSQVLTASLTFGRVAPLDRPLTPDVRVLVIATAVTIVVGLVVGIFPAWRASAGNAGAVLRQGRGATRTPGRSGKILVLAQVALAMVLVVGAGLFVGTLSRLHANVDNVRARPIVWTRLSRNPGDRGTPLGRQYYETLVAELSSIRGADAAALSYYFPAFLGNAVLPSETFAVVGPAPSPETTGLTEFVSPGFFDLFDIPRLRGRDFTWHDDEHAPMIAIVSQSLASKLFPTGDVIGRTLRVASGSTRTDVAIVGVVADAPIGGIREPSVAVVFRPMMQDLTRAQSPMTSVRVSGESTSVREDYRRAVESHGHHFVRGLFTMSEWIGFALLRERLLAGLSSCAAALAVLLACIGLYGVLAYAVTSRVHEIGVRIALGASRGDVLRMIVRDGLVLVVPGVLIGVPCALAGAAAVRSQLYGLTPNDPATIIGAAAVFTVTGLAATLLPATRASKINPIDALRQD